MAKPTLTTRIIELESLVDNMQGQIDGLQGDVTTLTDRLLSFGQALFELQSQVNPAVVPSTSKIIAPKGVVKCGVCKEIGQTRDHVRSCKGKVAA